MQIRRLGGNACGLRLFDRNSRKVALTPTGAGSAAALQKSLHDMEHVLIDARRARRRRERHGAHRVPADLCGEPLPDLVQAAEGSRAACEAFRFATSVASMGEHAGAQ